jgi:hypothetical protein
MIHKIDNNVQLLQAKKTTTLSNLFALHKSNRMVKIKIK